MWKYKCLGWKSENHNNLIIYHDISSVICVFFSRLIPAFPVWQRPWGDPDDQDTVHEFLGRPDHRPRVSGDDHGGQQSAPGRGRCNIETNALYIQDWHAGLYNRILINWCDNFLLKNIYFVVHFSGHFHSQSKGFITCKKWENKTRLGNAPVNILPAQGGGGHTRGFRQKTIPDRREFDKLMESGSRVI